MIKLNDNSIVVGQIKQLLHTFNLPQCTIGSAYPKAGSHYLTKNHIMLWDGDKDNLTPIPCEKYVYGEAYTNLTTTLPINNMMYDVETHQYLGKYLRFLRDYNGINLMSMYNCWDGSINSRDFTLKFAEENGDGFERLISFKSGEDDSIVYKIPISISDFTIAIYGAVTVQMCVYADIKSGKEINTNINAIAKATYRKRRIRDLFTYSPFSENLDDNLSQVIVTNSQNLYLLLKVPTNLNTSITVLEGNYINDLTKFKSSFEYKPLVPCDFENIEEANGSLLATIQRSILDAQQESDGYAQARASTTTETGYKLQDVTKSYPREICAQLLSRENINSKYLLADRLVEYLTGNVISPISNDYEIARVQKALDVIRGANTADQLQDKAVMSCKEKYKSIINKRSSLNLKTHKARRYIGIWHAADLEDLQAISQKSGASCSYDSLGYLDKDLEEILKGVLDYVEI